jgi:hypothetical protein
MAGKGSTAMIDYEKYAADLEEELVSTRISHWELVQQLVKAENTIEVLTEEIKVMERQIDRRTQR